MSNQPDSHSVRRFVFPGEHDADLARPRTDPPASPEGLHVCPECRCELVQPVAWVPSAGGTWELTLECPNCHWRMQGMFDPDHVDALEDRLDEGVASMLADLRRLTRANMSEDIERFVAALQEDWILPEDF